MAGIVIIDTCVLFDFMSGRDGEGITEKLLSDSAGALSVISVYEMFRGVENKRHIEQRKELVNLCAVLEITEPISKTASNIYTTLKKSGKLIPNQDILIAATAIHWKYPLFTRNKKDFANIKNLQLL